MMSGPATISATHWTKFPAGEWRWRNFTPREMADRDTGYLVIVPHFMAWLQGVREIYARPMVISSGYRAPLRQFELTGRRQGAHVDGMAVDVLVSGEDAELLERIAIQRGVLGRGVMQVGAHHKRYLHLDLWTKAPKGTRPALWSY